MAWVLLVFAGFFEIVFALAMKRSDGFSRLPETLVVIGAAIISLVLLTQALRHLPVGTAYAVWTGIGAVGVAIVGIIWLGESTDLVRLGSLALVTIGIIGLGASGAHA